MGLASLLLLIAGGSLEAQTQDLPALDCVINPHKVFDLGSGVRGVINKINVERSDFVEANQVVAELDAGVERASVAVAKARADITSEVRLGELNLAFDQRRKKRMDDLYEAKSVSIQNKEDAELEAEISRQRLYEATERESIRKLELWRAQEQLEQKIVRSPSSGFVLKKFKSEGEYIEDQPIVRIAQLDQLSVEVIAPMDLFGKIKVGMSADIYPETLKSKPHRARVSVVDRMGDIASGTFGVRLNLPNADYA
ncbi:MAG: efflux RND transporter periplasmic adaptor subunit, partial [Lysobacterales bacterium]